MGLASIKKGGNERSPTMEWVTTPPRHLIWD